MRVPLVAGSLLFVAASSGIELSVASIGVPGAPQRLDAADLNGDGEIDLFVVGRGAESSATLQVLLNDHGHFSPGWSAVESTFVDGAWDVDLADTDADGDTDVVYVVPYGSPRERLNGGHAQFGSLSGIPTASFKFENELADMDGDGHVDLVYYEPDIFFDIYFGTMQGVGSGIFNWDFTTELALVGDPELHRRIALGDTTGDGLRDAAFTSLNKRLRLFRGKPHAAGSTLPGWLSPLVVYDKPCGDAVIVDLDGDLRLDLVASVPSLDSVVVLLSTPAGAFGSPQLFPAGEAPDAIEAADLDLDGAPDVIVTNPKTGSVSVLRGSGNGALQEPVRRHVGRGPTDLVAADLDGDGRTDLAVTCDIAGHVALVFNDSL